MEFGKNQKKDCFDYCKQNNLVCFQRDLNASLAKMLIADTYENIFNKIKNGQNCYYEYWDSTKNIKLFIDYDNKSESYSNYKNDILNIITTVQKLIPDIKDVYILKSIPDKEKKSYHIIFGNVYFSNRGIMKKFIEEQLKPNFKELFDSKIIDLKVYGDLCFRTLLSTKYSQNRVLYLLETKPFLTNLQENIIPKDKTTIKHFLNTCISYTNNCEIFNFKPEKKKSNSTTKKLHLLNDEDIYSDKEVVKKYLDLLDGDRYTDYNKWLNIGFILYSINPEYIDLWHYFSAKWEHYDEKICQNKWNTFANSEYIYTLDNLVSLAQLDNPDDCMELSIEIPNHDIKFLRPFDNVLSKLVYRLYGNTFVCSNPKLDEWYFFNGIRWKKENKSYNLRKKITNEIFNKIESYRKQLIRENANEEIIKNYYGILHKLGSGVKLNCLDIEFYNENFYKIIDQNKELLGFDNGVYDLNTMEFRNGRSSDYVSMSTGYDYIYYEKTNQKYIDLMSLISQILPEPETRHFTLKSIASCLDGHNKDENFYIWSGKNASGGNGKSTLMELLTKTLGEYAIDSPVSLITRKRESANSPNSALAAIRNKRVVIMQEPSSNDQIQVDIMKTLTGGDRISTRDLNSTQIEFKPHAKYFLACNKIPSISDIDGGVIRRLKITEFVSRFVEKLTEGGNKEGFYEFKLDKNLKNKLESYKAVFMCILLNYYLIYKEEGLIPPKTVQKVILKYERSNNHIKTFIDEHLQKTNKIIYSITREELKQTYNSDISLRNTFRKFSDFATQLENALCTEFKTEPKSKKFILEGYTKRRIIQDSDNEDSNYITDCSLDSDY